MKGIIAGVFFWILSNICFATVPHCMNRYGFSMELPDGFTQLVEQENINQRLYDAYMGCADSKSFVHVWIAKQIHEENYVGSRLKKQLAITIDLYKKQGAEIVNSEIIQLPPHEAFIINSKHDGAEFLTLMMYHNCVMYVVSANIAKNDKYGVKEFYPMLKSVKIN